LIAVVVVLIFLSIPFPETQSYTLVSAILLISIMTICGITFLIYGILLALQMREVNNSFTPGRKMESVSSNADEISEEIPFSHRCLRIICCVNRRPPSKDPTKLWMKMFLASLTVAFCFIVESIMQILNYLYVENENGAQAPDTIYTALFYAFDLLALFTILLIFRRMVRTEVSRQISKTFPKQSVGSRSSHHNGNNHHVTNEPSGMESRSPSRNGGFTTEVDLGGLEERIHQDSKPGVELGILSGRDNATSSIIA